MANVFDPFINGNPLGMAVGAGIGLINSSYQNAQNRKNMQLQNQLNEKYFDYTTAHQEARQDFLNANQYSILKKSLQDAGLSTAGLTPGAQLAGASPLGVGGSATALPSQGGFLDGISAMASLSQASASAKLAEAQAEGQQIQNNRANAEDAQYRNFMFNILFGDEIAQIENDSSLTEKERVQKIEELKVTADGKIQFNKGTYDAWMQKFQYEPAQAKADLEKSRSLFDKAILDMQGVDTDVKSALSKMPDAVYKELCQSASTLFSQEKLNDSTRGLQDAEKSYYDAMEEMQRNNNIMSYVNKIFEGEDVAKNVLKVLFLGMLNMVGINFNGSVGMNFGRNTSHNTTSSTSNSRVTHIQH